MTITAFAENSVGELARLYKLVNTLSDYQNTVAKLPELEQAAADTEDATGLTQEAAAGNDDKAKKQLSFNPKAADCGR